MAKFDYVKLDSYCAGTTDLSAAINNALTSGLGPSGGTIDATNVDTNLMKFETPVNVNKPLTLLLGTGNHKVAGPVPPKTLFNIMPPGAAVSFRLTGVDPTATTITAAASGTTIFQLAGDFFTAVGEGSPYFCVQRLKFDGNSASRSSILLSTISPPSIAPLHFEEGLLIVEDCLITNFGGANVGAAIQIGPSIYFCRFHRNQFLYNHQAIYVDSNSETSIRENSFVQGKAGGASLTLVGPMNRVVHNYFYRMTLPDTSNEPDILLLPRKSQKVPDGPPIDVSGQSGGYAWIEDNRFGAERENLDPRRTRIKLFSQLDATLIGGPVIVRGNQFSGPCGRIQTLSGNGSSVTVTLKTKAAQGLTPGTIVTIHEALDQTFNGTFAVETVLSDSSFTYALASDKSSSGGAVYLAGSDSLGFTPMAIISASRIDALVTVEVARTDTLRPGKVVTINGASDQNNNGTYSIKEVSSTEFSTRFTYTLPVIPSAVESPPGGGPGVVYATNGAAITLMNPHGAWDVSGNNFLNYQTLINDYQTQVAQAGYGQSLLVDNRVHSRSLSPRYQVFANEGRNFSVVRFPSDAASPAHTTLSALDAVPRRNETRFLRNRIAQSEALQAWTFDDSIAVSKSSEMPDPFGSLRAFKLTLRGMMKGRNIAQKIDKADLEVGSRLVIKFWAKRGTLSMLRVGVRHVNANHWHGNLFTVSLGSDWRLYKFVTNGLVSVTDTDSYALTFYPGDSNQTTGDIFLFAPQVSDDDTDYYPTADKWVHDPSAGNRFEQAPVITSLKTMTNTGAPLPAPKSTWVEANAPTAPTGAASLQPGSSDFAGVIELKVTSGKPTSGTVEVTYAKAYSGKNSPVVVACLVNSSTGGSGAWGSASVRAESSNGAFKLGWTDSEGLSAGKAYGLSYIVIGRT